MTKDEYAFYSKINIFDLKDGLKKPPKNSDDKHDEKESNSIIVKIFRLLDKNWVDLGFVGLLKYSYENMNDLEIMEDILKSESEKKLLTLTIKNRENGQIIVKHCASNSIEYQRESDTIISWAEGDQEIALSFLNKKDCELIYDLLCSVDQNFTLKKQENSKNDLIEKSKEKLVFGVNYLEKMKIENIDLFVKAIKDNGKLNNKLIEEFRKESFLENAFDLHSKLEDFEDIENLEKMQIIFFNLISWNEQYIEDIFSPLNINNLIAILEYDYSQVLKNGNKICDRYRKILKTFKQKNLPISLPREINIKIQHFQKLKLIDTVIFSYYKNDTSNIFSPCISKVRLEIIESIFDIDWISNISEKISSLSKNWENNSSEIENLLKVLVEFFNLIRDLTFRQKFEMYIYYFFPKPLFKCFEVVLKQEFMHKFWVNIFEIINIISSSFLGAIFLYNSNVNEDEELFLCSLLFDIMISEKHSSFSEKIRNILLKIINNHNQIKKRSIDKLAAFKIPKLTCCLSLIPSTRSEQEVVYSSLEILNAFAKIDSFNLKSGLLSRALLKAIEHISEGESRICLSALRFVIKCGLSQESILVNNFLKSKAISVMIDLSKKVCEENNLFSSTLYSFFYQIVQRENEIIIQNILKCHKKELEKLKGPVFAKILNFYENKEKIENNIIYKEKLNINSLCAKKVNRDKTNITKEEEYFSSNDNEMLDDIVKLVEIDESKFIERKKVQKEVPINLLNFSKTSKRNNFNTKFEKNIKFKKIKFKENPS